MLEIQRLSKVKKIFFLGTFTKFNISKALYVICSLKNKTIITKACDKLRVQLHLLYREKSLFLGGVYFFFLWLYRTQRF